MSGLPAPSASLTPGHHGNSPKNESFKWETYCIKGLFSIATFDDTGGEKPIAWAKQTPWRSTRNLIQFLVAWWMKCHEIPQPKKIKEVFQYATNWNEHVLYHFLVTYIISSFLFSVSVQWCGNRLFFYTLHWMISFIPLLVPVESCNTS